MAKSTGRPAAMRALAQDLEDRFGTRFEAQYHEATTWNLSWSLGPLYETVRSVVDQRADRLAGATVRLSRGRGGDREIALAAIRLALDGALEPERRWGGEYSAHSQAEHYLDHTEYPERATPREEAMARRLMQQAAEPRTFGTGVYVNEYTMCKLVDDRGISFLLESPATDLEQDGRAEAENLHPSALEVLTARYATGEAARAWRRTARTLSARQAVDTALTDPQLSGRDALAVLAVLQQLRAELDGQERQTAAVLSAGVAASELTYDDVGRALGVTRQSAHTWVMNRLHGRPPRRRAPRN